MPIAPGLIIIPVVVVAVIVYGYISYYSRDSQDEKEKKRNRGRAAHGRALQRKLGKLDAVQNMATSEEKFVQAQTPAQYNLPPKVTLRQRIDIKLLENGNVFITDCIKIGNKLVFANKTKMQLIVINVDGNVVYRIGLIHHPWFLTEVDSETVAVSCSESTIRIVNISKGVVNRIINARNICWGISYKDENLFVIVESDIQMMDLTGRVIRTISIPSNFDISVHGNKLVGICEKSIYGYSLYGEIIWMFENDKYESFIRVTTDEAGNVYVTNENTHNVVVVFDNGERHTDILTGSDGMNIPRGIHFDKTENVLLVCNTNDGMAFLFDVKYET